ncbi:hypothetical protein [Rhizobium sp. 1399]|uniref:hypothetical protein n=1 Tax=Rhizobium sp. 1399 TaxID=2817758 RepID=UPI0028673FE1|nr:hypothetical protein [Rhizobium sp. 1399]MDR6664827.1 hypothetical protein [Rhizobium sp. 1399]
MAKVTVYRARTYDVTHDEYELSSRYWTLESADSAKLTIDETPAVDVDEADVSPEGCTDRDYGPNRLGGFQTTVRS